MTANTPRTRKAKGRKFQQEIRDTFRKLFSGELEQDDINCTLMSESGVDIKLTPAAKKLIPLDMECKKQQKLAIWQALQQSQDNITSPERIPTLIFSRSNSKTYIVMEFEKFLSLMYPERIKALSSENIPKTEVIEE
jgi:hypothetical protein